MRIHELKCWPEEFQATLAGQKPYEIRKDDRRFEVFDVVHLREWDPYAYLPLSMHTEKITPGRYTGHECAAVITHITKGPAWEIPEGYVVLGLGVITAVAANSST